MPGKQNCSFPGITYISDTFQYTISNCNRQKHPITKYTHAHFDLPKLRPHGYISTQLRIKFQLLVEGKIEKTKESISCYIYHANELAADELSIGKKYMTKVRNVKQ